jgi:NTE family protein
MKIGIALGGGGVRGLAHVLALEVIDACGIKPVAITGTSMGAIIGAMYASGLSAREIRAVIDEHIITKGETLSEIYRKKENLVKWLSAVRPTRSKGGLLKANGFLHYLLDEIKIDTFDELSIPLDVIATDFHRGEAVVFNRGELLPAIQASMSIPGIFAPVKHNGQILVDGGVVNNLPYTMLSGKCDVTIAVDVAPTRCASDSGAPNMIEATLGMFDILVETITDSMLEEKPPTIYVHPRLVGIRTLEFEKIEDVLEQSKPAMKEFQENLTELLATQGE